MREIAPLRKSKTIPSAASTGTPLLFPRPSSRPSITTKVRGLSKPVRVNMERPPSVGEPFEVRIDPATPHEGLALDGDHRRRPFEIWCRQRGERVDLASIESAYRLLGDLSGLLRHRPEYLATW